MMKEIIELFTNLSKSNPLLFGFMMVALGALGNTLRTIPRDIYNWIWRVFTCRIEISNHDELYEHVKLWLNQQPYSQKSRSLVGSSEKKYHFEDDNISGPQEYYFTPAPGNHFFFYDKQLICVSIFRDKQDNVFSNGKELPPPKETITICMPGRNQNRIRNLINKIVLNSFQHTKNKAHIYIMDGSYWTKTSSVNRRPISSVILPEGVAKKAVDDIQEFRASREWYKSIGIPYHRGYLLHGIPGAGKSSLVSALSDELNLNLYTINLSSGRLTDDDLTRMMMNMKPDSIILIEDIDAIFNGRKNMAKSELTFSGLLNAIDGVSSREGTILFMTTNHREKLDPALIRPGRIDVEICFGPATEKQIADMIKRFYPHAENTDRFIIRCQSNELSMAQIQKHFLKYKNSYQQAYENINEMLENKFLEASDVAIEENEEQISNENYVLPPMRRGRIIQSRVGI